MSFIKRLGLTALPVLFLVAYASAQNQKQVSSKVSASTTISTGKSQEKSQEKSQYKTQLASRYSTNKSQPKWPGLPKKYSFRESFLPLNDVSIPVNYPRQSEVTEQIFVRILNKVWGVYAPDFGMRGLIFQPAMDWKSDVFNAYAYQENGTAYVVMLGGLARFSELTADGFAFIACHEIGHHLGGLPTYLEGASSEGESDYFAAVKCLRRVFAMGETWGVASPFSPQKSVFMDPYALQLCDSVYVTQADRLICYRITAAGQSVANAFSAIDRAETGQSRIARFQTPSTSEAIFALAHHPPTQCRLDTALQGALCPAPLSESFSFGTVVKGGCHPASQRYRIGFRPKCWYNDRTPPDSYWKWLEEQRAKSKERKGIAPRIKLTS